ncbi:MAG: serine hydrolase [Acidimicrobiales bacterium]
MKPRTSREVRSTAGTTADRCRSGSGVKAGHRCKAMRTGGAMAAALLVTAVAVTALCSASAPVGATGRQSPRSALPAGSLPVKMPSSPVGKQLGWLLGIASQLPLSNKAISAHFDAAFLAQVSPAELNQALESLAPPGSQTTLLQLSKVEARSLVALVRIGPSLYSVELGVDSAGLIAGLLFKPAAATVVPQSWSKVDSQLAQIAPGVSLLAAKVDSDGSCSPVHSVLAGTPRPLGSMFKLFVLGALAQALHDHRLSWNQKVTVIAALKVGESGTLQGVPDGTKLTVEQAAVKMISVSDNTAADMLLELVGRSAVENQVRNWSSHAALDVPFLTVSEMFALKYHDFPAMADHYLSLNSSERAAYLTSTVDKVTAGEEQSASAPRDINSIEWFASADDICRALAGLAKFQAEPGLGPIATVLSTNNGGLNLNSGTWPRVWFKGGSDPGVLTLGYLARDSSGQTFVVVVLTEDTAKPVQESLSVEIQALDVAAGAFGLLR